MSGTDQSSNPRSVELDQEAKQLALREVKAKSAKAIAEAERDAARASFPQTTVKGAEGKLDVSDKSGFVADLAAHAVLEHAARWVARSVPEDAQLVVLLEDRNLLASDWAYVVVRDQMEAHTRALDAALVGLGAVSETPAQPERASEGLASARGAGRRGLAPAPMMFGAAVGAAADIAGLLRSDYALVGRQVTISTSALAAAVAGRLARRAATTTVLDGFALVDESGVLARLKELRERREKVAWAYLELEEVRLGPPRREIDAATAMIAELEKDRLKAAEGGKATDAIDARLAQLRADRQQTESRVAPLRAVSRSVKAALDAADAFITAATTVPPSGYPPIVAAAIRERLHQADGLSAQVLYVTADAAGGETITRRGLFRRTLLLFMGGCQVSYLRLDVSGKRLTGGSAAWTAHVRYDFRKHELTQLAVKRLALRGNQAGAMS